MPTSHVHRYSRIRYSRIRDQPPNLVGGWVVWRQVEKALQRRLSLREAAGPLGDAEHKQALWMQQVCGENLSSH
jgi:hypothetical protein